MHERLSPLPRVHPRSPRALSLALLISVAAIACAKEPAPELGVAEHEAAYVLELGQVHSAAEVWCDVERVRPGRFEQRGHLARGWSFPNQSPDDLAKSKTKPDPVWADGDRSEVLFYFAEVCDRRISFRSGAYEPGEGREQRVKLYLNDTPLEEITIPRKPAKFRIDLPAAAQREGLNTFALEFAYRARPRDVHGESVVGDFRTLAAHFDLFEIAIQDDDVEDRAKDARELVPLGSEASRATEDAPWAVEQVSRSVLAHHFAVPPGGRLVGSTLYWETGEEEVEAARFRLTLTPDQGTPEVLWDQALAYRAEELPFDISLEKWEGEVVRLDFSVEAADGSPNVCVGTWIAPAVTGSAPPTSEAVRTPEKAAAKVGTLRKELKGAPVVVILLDALNPSFLSCYGGRAGLTPNIDRLAAEGVLFENAAAQASYTISSVASLLSGRYTWEHNTWLEQNRMPEGVRRLPAEFRDAGYRTAAITHTPNGSSRQAFDQGFETYVDLWRVLKDQKPIPHAEDVLKPLDEILKADDERPLFLWLHIIEPHEPYSPPQGFAGKIDPSYDGTVVGDAKTLWAIRKWKLRPTERDIEHLKAQYQENLAYVDHVVGQVRERLSKAGIFEDAVVALISDHGEGFLDHDGKAHAGMGHGSTVYQEMVRIPLVFRLPAGLIEQGQRRRQPVAGFDVLPTLADLVGLPAPSKLHHGVSLAPMLVAPEAASRSFVLSHSASFHGRWFLPALSIRIGDWKYVYTSGEPPELYDLAQDPGERNDLVDERPVRAGYMRQKLVEWSGFPVDAGAAAAGEVHEISGAELEQLRALGYVMDDE